MAWPRACAVLICAASAAVLAVCVVLFVRWPDVGAVDTVVTIVLLAPALVLGLLVALRRPRVWVGPLLCLVGAVPLLDVAMGDLWVAAYALHPAEVPAPIWLVGLEQGSWMLLYLPAALLMLTFPDGRLLPGRWWRAVAVGLLVLPATFLVLAAGDPAGYAPPFQDVAPLWRAPDEMVVVLYGLLPAFLGLLIAAAAAMVVRYRRTTSPVGRAQLRWFALGATLLPATLLLCWLSYLVLDSPDLVVIGLALTAVAIPAATAVALLRHDLYDVDRAFTAAVTYALVTAVLLTVFTVASIVAGLVVGRSSAPAAAAATAVSALLLAPLRTRLQVAVERRLYPLRRSVRSALTALRERIDDGRARPEDLEAALRTALHDPALRVGYVLPGRTDLVDDHGAVLHPGDDRQVPVRLGGTHVGALLPTTTVVSRELLRETASDVAVVVELVRSRMEIREALNEVAQSRARLLQAGYRERRRLERDLHDGAQQRLVSLGMSIRLAQRHLTQRHLSHQSTGTVDVDGLLDQAVAELSTAVAELRAIARGLRPLDLDSGLAPAIRSLVTAVPIPVRLELSDSPVPDDVAVTAYYVASEALANVVKHADAESVEVSVAHRDGHVHVRVADDGRGGAAARPGSGLAGLADRVAAAGGRLALGTRATGGTSIEAVLPCSR